MVNALIVGINGKAGSAVYNAAKDYGVNVVCGIDKTLKGSADCPVYKTFDEVKEIVELIIDFSSPDALPGVADYLKTNPCPFFTGVTGYNKKHEETFKKLSKIIPIFKTSNASLGVNVMKNLVKLASESLPDYSAYIVEKHRKSKKDAPSGTAILLKEAFTQEKRDAVSVFSLRGGEVSGEHEVIFICENEILTIKHQATSPNLFAEGALLCCKFLLTKKRGLYTFDDYLKEDAAI